MAEKKSAEILAIGTEILLGDIVNTNAQYIAQKLSAMGIDVYYQSVIGDNPDRLEAALELAKHRADIVITTGGLGPTYDDLSKETIAKSYGKKLVLHEPTRDRLIEIFKKYNFEMTPNNMKQAYMPEGCVFFKNDYGTAPGCAVIDDEGRIAIMLPGPPREMKPMFDNHAMKFLAQYGSGVIESRTIYTSGIGEAIVEDMLHDMMVEHKNPTIAPYAKDGECIVRVTAKAATSEEALALIDPVVEKVKDQLGLYVYGVDAGSIEAATVAELKKRGLKAAFAESCTGGLMAKRLTDVPGASEVFELGLVTYSNDMKSMFLGVDDEVLSAFGAVSSECAIEMAKGAYALSGADMAIGITGVAGPDESEGKPVGLVYIALYDGEKSWVKRLEIQNPQRDYIRIVASTRAFDMVRRAAIHFDA